MIYLLLARAHLYPHAASLRYYCMEGKEGSKGKDKVVIVLN
jgi:hypothetical protein